MSKTFCLPLFEKDAKKNHTSNFAYINITDKLEKQILAARNALISETIILDDLPHGAIFGVFDDHITSRSKNYFTPEVELLFSDYQKIAVSASGFSAGFANYDEDEDESDEVTRQITQEISFATLENYHSLTEEIPFLFTTKSIGCEKFASSPCTVNSLSGKLTIEGGLGEHPLAAFISECVADEAGHKYGVFNERFVKPEALFLLLEQRKKMDSAK